jgi:sugar lactone lactonase YvrE
MTPRPPAHFAPARSVLRPFLFLGVLVAGGCFGDRTKPDLVWGRRGTQDGDLVRPRAIAIDANDHLYIVDFTARIQVYDRDGNLITKDRDGTPHNHVWKTPDYRRGRPSGLSMDRDGNLIVSDSHYNCFRIFTPDGEELKVIGGKAGTAPGELGYVSAVVQDADGYYYVAEFGENERISKFDVDGNFIKLWGSHGTEQGQFQRARALALGPDGLLYVADSVNHRIQVFTRDGDLVRCWGEPGGEPGQLGMPYDLAFDKKGNLYVAERENHRVQKFTVEGKSLGCWGGPGRAPGQFADPWALVVDSKGYVHVCDTENNRVQRIKF